MKHTLENDTKSNFKRALLTTAALCTMGLSLAACQTTSSSSYQPQDMENLTQIDKVLMRAANDAQARGKADESLELLENMYRRNSNDPSIAARYARSLRYAQRYQRASIVLTPFARKYDEHKNTDVIIEYSALKSAMGDYGIAEEYGRQAVNNAAEIARGHHVLGIALDAQGHHKEAEEQFREALINWQGDPAALLNNLGLNLAAQGKVEEAIDVLSKAAAANPGRMEIERNLRIVKALRNVPYIAGEDKITSVPVPPVKPSKKEVEQPTEDATEKSVQAEEKPKEETQTTEEEHTADDNAEKTEEEKTEDTPPARKTRSLNE